MIIHYSTGLIFVSKSRRKAETDIRKYFTSLWYAVHSLNTSTDKMLNTRESHVHLITHFLHWLRITPAQFTVLYPPASPETSGTHPRSGRTTARLRGMEKEVWWNTISLSYGGISELGRAGELRMAKADWPLQTRHHLHLLLQAGGLC